MIVLVAAALSAVSFNPLTFFTGESHGTGTISILFKGAQQLHVTNHGRPDGHGGIVLDQSIYQGREAVKNRRWILRPNSATTLAGTLTDASGPVTGSIAGNSMSLAYPMKGGLSAQQTLTLQPGGRVLVNHMTVRKFGLTVATIDERIVKD